MFVTVYVIDKSLLWVGDYRNIDYQTRDRVGNCLRQNFMLKNAILLSRGVIFLSDIVVLLQRKEVIVWILLKSDSISQVKERT